MSVYLWSVFVLVLVFGSLLFLVEGGANPQFSSIPQSGYWAVTTMKTVGYGYVAPIAGLGRVLAVIIVIMDYGVIAVSAGIAS